MYRRWLALLSCAVLLILPLSACDYGYDILVTITVPVDVQQAFSPSRPGLVVDGSTVRGRLCSPTASPLVFRIKSYPIGVCSQEKAENDTIYGSAYAFDPTGFDVTYRSDGDAEAVKCGETAEVHGRGGYDVEIYDVFPPLVDKDKIATGSATGACTNGNYNIEISLSLP